MERSEISRIRYGSLAMDILADPLTMLFSLDVDLDVWQWKGNSGKLHSDDDELPESSPLLEQFARDCCWEEIRSRKRNEVKLGLSRSLVSAGGRCSSRAASAFSMRVGRKCDCVLLGAHVLT